MTCFFMVNGVHHVLAPYEFGHFIYGKFALLHTMHNTYGFRNHTRRKTTSFTVALLKFCLILLATNIYTHRKTNYHQQPDRQTDGTEKQTDNHQCKLSDRSKLICGHAKGLSIRILKLQIKYLLQPCLPECQSWRTYLVALAKNGCQT